MLLWVWGNILSYNMMFKSKNISFWLRIGDKNAKTPIWGRTLLIAPNDSLISIYRASSMQDSSILIRNIIVPTLSFFLRPSSTYKNESLCYVHDMHQTFTDENQSDLKKFCSSILELVFTISSWISEETLTILISSCLRRQN